MYRSKPYIFGTIASAWVLLIAVFSCDNKRQDPEPEPGPPTPYNWVKPAHFPDPAYDMAQNPLTNEGVRLGMFLFYDGVLSRTNVIGCGTCHQQQSAFTHHGHELSHGVDDLLGTRNSMPLQNMAWSPLFFWDGGVHDLDLSPLNALANPVEMDESMPAVVEKLRNRGNYDAKMTIDYPKMFEAAFGTDEINSSRVLKALSQFMLTMVSATSKYDFYLMGDQSALNAQEKRGLSLFEKNCASCHSGVLFTDHSFRNNGLVPMRINDLGRYEISGNDADRYRFKVPSLRNVAATFPYMHDGRYHTLTEVLQHYNDSIGVFLRSGSEAIQTLDPLLNKPERAGIALTNEEQRDIIAFLHTLTDEIFLRDPKLADPGIGNAF